MEHQECNSQTIPEQPTQCIAMQTRLCLCDLKDPQRQSNIYQSIFFILLIVLFTILSCFSVCLHLLKPPVPPLIQCNNQLCVDKREDQKQSSTDITKYQEFVAVAVTWFHFVSSVLQEFLLYIFFHNFIYIDQVHIVDNPLSDFTEHTL